MFPQPFSFVSSSFVRIRPPSIQRVPGSLEIADEAIHYLSSQQILHTIFKDIDIHSKQDKPEPRKTNKRPKLVQTESTTRGTTKEKEIKEVAVGCNCRKSRCLKLYCDCFAGGEFCRQGCNCEDCANNISHNSQRMNALVSVLDKEPNAFLLKKKQSMREKEKGCTCRRSFCRKKYCECFADGVECSKHCKCEGCLNCKTDDSQLELLVKEEREIAMREQRESRI